MLIETPADSEEIEEIKANRVGDGVLHGPGSQVGYKVQERARNRGGRYLIAECALPRAQGPNAVEPDPRPIRIAAGGRWLGDVDQPSARRHQTPVRCGIPVTQHRRFPAREHRGAPPTLPREERMADRVDGFVQAMQSADCQPVLDCACAETELAELGVRRDGVMIGRKGSDPMIHVVSPSHVKG
jgi:hypothetical protein